MWWKRLGLPIQSLIFGFVVALLAMAIAHYLAGGRSHDQPPLCSWGAARVDCTWPGLAPVYLPGQGRN